MDPDLFDQKPAPRKLRFKPKAQARRAVRPAAPKIEVTDDAETAEAKELMRRFQDGLAGKPKVERKVEPVRPVFGYGSAVPSHQYNGQTYQDKARALREPKEYKEPWNYYSYYPTTLPLRRPYSGKPDVLDEEEFEQASAFDETKSNAAMELGLMEENAEPRMLFFQLPKAFPMTKRPTAAVGEAPGSSKPPRGFVERPCKLNDIKPGSMGKMLVYKSGAVKLKLGDTIYDVTPGSDSGFARDVAAVNVEKKHMCAVGEISKHVILTPDVNSILDNFADLG